ncbi:Uncharacterised protein [Pseudomonas aeruginosa]|nr:Uncharacterised protein [Pseudomonas aeruginosa]
MRVEGEEGSLAGDMLIRLMRDPGAEDYMDLQVGLSDGDARFTAKYLPTRLPGMNKSLANWLKTRSAAATSTRATSSGRAR